MVRTELAHSLTGWNICIRAPREKGRGKWVGLNTHLQGHTQRFLHKNEISNLMKIFL